MDIKAVIILATCSAIVACNSSSPTGSTTERIKAVESNLAGPVSIKGDTNWTIEERMEHYGVPGVSIAVIRDFKIDWVKSYGVMNQQDNEPVSDKTLFQAGSISKPVAAYGALKLVEENRLSLDEDVNTFLRSWKLPESEFTREKKVALKHLLNHSGGVTVHGFLGYSPDLPVPTLLQVLDGVEPANSPPIRIDKRPEESFRYSGGGYCIMQQMMIDVSGKDFPLTMKELVLDPLEMTSSTYNQPLDNDQLKWAATGYLPDGSMTKGERHTYPEMAAAGLWTTAGDLARFAIDIQRTLKGETEKVLSRKMAEKMLTPFVEDFVGLGIFLDDNDGEMYFGHGGWDEGFSSEMVVHKEKGYGVVVLTNSNHPPFIGELIRSVALTYGWDNYLPVYEKMDASAEEMNRAVGRYREGSRGPITVFIEGRRLFSREAGTKPTELVKISDSTFTTRDNERLIQFKEDDSTGKIGMVIRDFFDRENTSTFTRMAEDEKLPIEFIDEGNDEAALEAYRAIQRDNPSDPSIEEQFLNGKGYDFLRSGNVAMAKSIFRINISLYPESGNVYDSYAEACMLNGDLDEAVENYQTSLKLDPQNSNAEEMLEKIEAMKKETETL